MKNKHMVRILSLVVVLSMIFTTVAFATPENKKFEKDSKKTELKDEDYNQALLSLIEKEIVKGYGKGDYGLSGNVKRGDVIVMIIRALDLEDDYDAKEISENYLNMMSDDEDDFDDVNDKSAYYYGPIKIAKKLGIAKGDGRYFKPNKPVTIQEAIWLIERAEDILDDDIDIDLGKIEELAEIYAGELNDFAKRRDVFWMLYYVLDGAVSDDDEAEETELTDIKLDMNDDSELAFSDSWFNRAFNVLKDADSDVEDLEYVEFELPAKNGTLYYDYDEDEVRNTLVNEETKYYIATEDDDDKEIKNITLVPKTYFSGTITIEYNAFDENGVSYQGFMKITVDGDEEVQEIKTITLTMDEDDVEDIDFLGKLEEKVDIIDNSLFDKLDYVKFTSIDRGELTIDYADDNNVGVELNKIYYFDHIDDDLTLEYTGTRTVNIQFTVYDIEANESYDGLIKITN
ncbi:MAG: S-layer homology domain-containing protein [Sedimentibacter sp.]